MSVVALEVLTVDPPSVGYLNIRDCNVFEMR